MPAIEVLVDQVDKLTQKVSIIEERSIRTDTIVEMQAKDTHELKLELKEIKTQINNVVTTLNATTTSITNTSNNAKTTRKSQWITSAIMIILYIVSHYIDK